MRNTARHNGHGAHHLPQPDLPQSHGEIARDLLGRFSGPAPRLALVAGLLGLLVVVGVAGFLLRLASTPLDPEHRAGWGYLAVAFAFLLTTAQAAPIFAVAMRMARNHWRRPLSRAAELYAVAGLLNVLLLIALLFTIPAAGERRTLWMFATGAPHAYNLVYLALLTLTGLFLLYISAVPDLAAVRDLGAGFRARLAGALAGFWRGTPGQWHLLHGALGVMGGLYFILYVLAHSLLSVDLAMVLVPGWQDAIFPTFEVLSSLQSAVALMVLTAFVLRQGGRLERYLGVEQFWAMSKLLLATSLLWFYFWWSAFITLWYGRTPAEQSIVRLLIFGGPYQTVFILAFLFSFLLPLLFLIWNPVRKSIWGPTLVSCFVLFGNLMDRVRVYVASFSVPNEEITAHSLEHLPPAVAPGAPDIMMMVGAVAGALLLYLLASRLVPVVSLWEVKEWATLRVVRTLVRRPVVVIGKPE